jgi:aminoglycoside phosphotransferase (APT) family kinase protein
MVEGIRSESVTRWLIEHVPDLAPPVAFSLIAGGHSNLTYSCVDSRGAAYVLRRPPLGHVLESAHDMGREHRIISALAGTDVPVAPTFGLCRDPAVNDAPFYVMKFVEGRVLHDVTVAGEVALDDRRRLGEHVADVLATLHGLDRCRRARRARPQVLSARQLNRWTSSGGVETHGSAMDECAAADGECPQIAASSTATTVSANMISPAHPQPDWELHARRRAGWASSRTPDRSRR